MKARKHSRIPVLLAGGAVIVVGLSWAGSRFLTERRPNIILISIDTCRADHLSCYGHPRKTTPNVDAVGREGVVFTNVVTPVPTTLPAHSSMLTGTVPPYHGVHANIAYRLRESNTTLAEALKEHGYRTAGFVGAFVLHAQFGIAQGFDTYDDEFKTAGAVTSSENERKAEKVTRATTAWLDKHGRDGEPFFLFVHYFDPHVPYQPPEPFASDYADAPYAGEVAYADHWIGKLIGHLKALGLYDSALLVITGDHGESLGDHGELQHGYFIYHSTTKVPLIVKLPGGGNPARVDDLVSLIDIPPTILSKVGVDVPEEVQGEDLSEYLSGKPPDAEQRFMYSESLTPTPYGCSSLLGIETKEWKYIQASRPELYELTKDPGETTNVIEQFPKRARMLRERLRTMLETQTRVFDSESTAVMDEETIARLESLGYVGGRMQEDFEFTTDKEDPKDFLEFFIAISRANRRYRAGELEQAISACRSILAQRQDIGMAHEILGKSLAKQGRADEAGAAFEELVRLQPRYPLVRYELGKLRLRQGRVEEAISAFEEAARLGGGGIESGDTLDRALSQFGQVDPTQFQARLNLAYTLCQAGRLEGCVEQYREALKLDPLPTDRQRYEALRAQAYYELGNALMQLSKKDEAAEAYREALRLKPDYPEVRRALDAASPPQGSTPPP